MTKAQKLLNDLPDAKESMKNKLLIMNEDLNNAKSDLKVMRNSIDIIENQDIKMLELTHVKMKLEIYDKEDSIFRFRMVKIYFFM